jgi:hypothetical protein
MQLKVDRFLSNQKSTIGRLYIDGTQVCFTLEDAYHEVKVPGETRIPAGTYGVHLKPFGTSRMDLRYSQLFGLEFHKGMLELQDVPNYSGVLIHVGNWAKDTEGCLLLGTRYSTDLDAQGSYSVQKSTDAYRLVYPQVRDVLLRGEAVTIEVVDGDRNQAMV